MSTSLTLLGYDGALSSLVASLREAAPRIAAIGATLAVFEGKSMMTGAKVPTVLVLVRSQAAPSEATLASVRDALAIDAAPTIGACFAYLRSFGGQSGRATRAMLVGMTDCASPDVREAFERWYDEHHAIDVVRSEMYFVAERHQRAAGDAPEFLALYATEGEEPDTFSRYLAWEPRDRTHTEAAVVRNVWTFRFVFASPEVMTWN